MPSIRPVHPSCRRDMCIRHAGFRRRELCRWPPLHGDVSGKTFEHDGARPQDAIAIGTYFAEFMVVEVDYIDNDVTPRIEYGADIYKIDYCTVDFD